MEVLQNMNLENTYKFSGKGHVYSWETDYRVIMPDLTDRMTNLAFVGLPWSGNKQALRKYIHFLSQNEKVIIIDSEGDMESYNRFKKIKKIEQFQSRYHMKLSANDFIYSNNIFNKMDEKSISILKIKSIDGIMSAGELFPVIMQKIESERFSTRQKINIILNQSTIKHISSEEFEAAYLKFGCDVYRFIFLCESLMDLPQTMVDKTGNLVLFRHSSENAIKLKESLNLDSEIIEKVMDLPVKLSIVI